MKIQLKSRGVIPYGGYFKFREPATGQYLNGGTWDMLLQTVRDYRKANGIPLGLDFEDEVETQVCRNQPDECDYIDDSIPRDRQLSMSDVIRGTKVLLSFKLAGSPLVSREEAERRGSICSGCRFNVTFPRPCTGLCPELRDLVVAIVGNQGTQYDKDLKSCSICGCFTQAHIWLPLDILDKGLTEGMRSAFNSIPHCWKKTKPITEL